MDGQWKHQSIPFSLYPMLFFGNLVDTLVHSLCPYRLDVPGAIIVDDGGDLWGPGDIILRWKPTQSPGWISWWRYWGIFRPTLLLLLFLVLLQDQAHWVIKYESVNSARLQVCIPVRNATICSSYVKCQDQFSTTTGEWWTRGCWHWEDERGLLHQTASLGLNFSHSQSFVVIHWLKEDWKDRNCIPVFHLDRKKVDCGLQSFAVQSSTFQF